MAKHWINFKDVRCITHSEFRSRWKELAGDKVHLMICSCEYKKSTRLIFTYKEHRLTYYLKYSVSEKMTMDDCIYNLMDTIAREWRNESKTTDEMLTKGESNEKTIKANL